MECSQSGPVPNLADVPMVGYRNIAAMRKPTPGNLADVPMVGYRNLKPDEG